MDIKQRVGLRLRTFRKAKGMTQEDLAGAAGKAVQTVSDFERGKIMPRYGTLEEFARVLGVSLGDFFDLGQEAKSAARIEAEARAVGLLRSLPDEALNLAAAQIEAIAKAFPRKEDEAAR